MKASLRMQLREKEVGNVKEGLRGVEKGSASFRRLSRAGSDAQRRPAVTSLTAVLFPA